MQNFLKYFTCPYFWHWKWFICLPNERKYLLNGLQNFLKDSNSYYFVLKSTKEIENSSAVYETKWIMCSMDFKTSFKDFNSDYFVLRVWKKLKIVQLISHLSSWLSVQRILKTFSNMFLGLLLCQFCLIVVNINWNFSNWFSQVTSDKCLIYYYFKSRNCLFFVRTSPSIIIVIWCVQYFCLQTSCSSNRF